MRISPAISAVTPALPSALSAKRIHNLFGISRDRQDSQRFVNFLQLLQLRRAAIPVRLTDVPARLLPGPGVFAQRLSDRAGRGRHSRSGPAHASRTLLPRGAHQVIRAGGAVTTGMISGFIDALRQACPGLRREKPGGGGSGGRARRRFLSGRARARSAAPVAIVAGAMGALATLA